MPSQGFDGVSKNQGLINVLLILMVVFLSAGPLLLVKNAEFGGADEEAESTINKLVPGYQPWFAPLFEPASGEIESLLFALQAALGAGVIGYGLGYLKARHQN